MNIDFNNVNRIPVIEQKFDKLYLKLSDNDYTKWLTTEEAAKYTRYSKDSIDRFVKSGELKLNVHYHQKGKKRIFSKSALDSWIIGESIISEKYNNDFIHKIDEIIKDHAVA